MARSRRASAATWSVESGAADCWAAAADTALLFEGAPAQGSFAYVPLRDGDTFGLLALASDDPKRYYAGMGTLYLQRLGELVACALAVHLPK